MSFPGGFRDPRPVKMGVFREQRSKQILASPKRITPPPPRPGGRSRNGQIRNGLFLILPFRTIPPGAVKHQVIWARPRFLFYLVADCRGGRPLTLRRAH